MPSCTQILSFPVGSAHHEQASSNRNARSIQTESSQSFVKRTGWFSTSTSSISLSSGSSISESSPSVSSMGVGALEAALRTLGTLAFVVPCTALIVGKALVQGEYLWLLAQRADDCKGHAPGARYMRWVRSSVPIAGTQLGRSLASIGDHSHLFCAAWGCWCLRSAGGHAGTHSARGS